VLRLRVDVFKVLIDSIGVFKMLSEVLKMPIKV
jgi:hypothetical protein